MASGHSPATPKHTNRLAQETSPYLLQHAHNPVDWYAWGDEAFEASRKQNKPIFLSVGYSTCYWCHVMERQSFENEAIAAEMNKRFINIKVDREERPDVDQLYMTAVQVLTQHGGWPMSVFLTPELKPFYGGTYFPPSDMHGRPGFPTLLRGIEDAYRNRKGDVDKSAEQIVSILNQLAEPSAPTSATTIDRAFIDNLVGRSVADYDAQNGGFGGAPKFPRETLLEMLLAYSAADESEISDFRSQILKRVRHTLDALALGGIRDHLGGGFHRYSTDAHWLVPHFEIMLYDNAMLAYVYLEAFRQTEEQRYAHVARGILDFVLREMTSPEGGFYTAFDAEVDHQEGLNYLWTADEIEQLLGAEDAKLFNRIYGVDQGPNFADPHHGTGAPDKSILFLHEPVPAEHEARLEKMRRTLYTARAKRKQPLLDTKIITSWNALMLRAFAYAGQILQEQKYLDAAAKNADFLLRHHRVPDGGLCRTSRDGVVKFDGFLDDYAFLIQALIALRDASGKEQWKEHAAALAIQMADKFEDIDRGGFYFTQKDATDLIVRQKVGSDSPLPSGNAVAAMAMLALDQSEVTQKTIAAFAQQMLGNGEGMGAMVQAALVYLRREGEITVQPGTDANKADRPLSPEQLAAGVVSMNAAWSSPTKLNVHVKILKGFHINAHEASKGLIATQLSVNEAEVAGIDYPAAEERQFAFADGPIRVYDGEVQIVVRFKKPQTGASRVKVSLSYQACDERACLPPVTKQIKVTTP